MTLMNAELSTSLKRNTARILKKVRTSKKPILITEHGLPAAYLVDCKTMDDLHLQIEILEGIARGEQDVTAGRVLTHDQVVQKLAKWLGK